MKPEYILEVWSLGVLIVAPPPQGSGGVPIEAFTSCCKLLPKNAVMDGGIPHHYRARGDCNAIAAAGTSGKLKEWRKEIEKSIEHLEPETRWWIGTDVGTSSAAIFAVLCKPGEFKHSAKEFSKGAEPLDADDLGRCLRLLDRFPHWRSRMPEVAAAYPETLWPRLVSLWELLRTSVPQVQREILKEVQEVKTGFPTQNDRSVVAP